jgi:3-hydroxyisobutyrate dehydrogenase-like beta-hydroxyacid dehydrogenase
MKPKIGVLGIGMMGAAFAKLYLHAGYQVNVWNRSPEKSHHLIEHGARVATTVSALVQDSEIIFAAVANSSALRDLLHTVGEELTGRLIVNLVTGTAEDARSIAALVSSKHASYLDGAIEAYPDDIGKKQTLILFSGPYAVWNRHAALLGSAGGASRWVGEDFGAANILDTAMAGSFGIGCLGAFIESANYASKSGVDLSELESTVDYFLALVKKEILSVLTALSTGHLDDSQAPLSVYVSAMKTWQENMVRAGAPAVMLSAHLKALEAALEKGHGNRHIAATYLD